MPAADVALLTDRRYTAAAAADGDWYLANILADDRLLRAALAARGLTAARVDWADPAVEWSRFGCAVFRTTWDYYERFPEFTAWLDRVERLTRLCNPPATVRWNTDKHYLADLAGRGVPLQEVRRHHRHAGRRLGDVLDQTGWDEVVYKPCVSGAARHTYRANRRTAAAHEPALAALLAAEAMMVQPFQSDIVGTGEDTLTVFAGRYCHAVRKVPKAGDFRVQDDHGGTVRPHRPTAEQVDLAERAVAACSPRPVYGRADLVRGNDGRPAVMELELIEPELWLRLHPPAADAFADAVVAFLADRPAA
jgi:glutathione synthase/RimK-type ligase-like ATP-grasp enzyme